MKEGVKVLYSAEYFAVSILKKNNMVRTEHHGSKNPMPNKKKMYQTIPPLSFGMAFAVLSPFLSIKTFYEIPG